MRLWAATTGDCMQRASPAKAVSAVRLQQEKICTFIILRGYGSCTRARRRTDGLVSGSAKTHWASAPSRPGLGYPASSLNCLATWYTGSALSGGLRLQWLNLVGFSSNDFRPNHHFINV